mgnify:CR=1 FL=1
MKNNTDEFVDQILESRQKLANDNADLKDLVDSLEKQLSIQRVSQQRELLQKIESVKNFEWGINPVDNENRMCELIKLL